MNSILKRLARTPILGRFLLMMFRLKAGWTFASRPTKQFAKWLFTSREFTNYTFDLDETNERYLAAFVSHVSGVSSRQAYDYMMELENDDELRSHILRAMAESSERRFADREVRYGKRLGWYAIVRAVKPRVVVETGVDKGLGSCVLAAALRRNAQEGVSGYLYGTDIDPDAGYILGGEYGQYGEVLYGDSIRSLEALDATIDVFINDSDHSAAYEAREYHTVEDKLNEGAIVIGDNAHVTDMLWRFAERTGREFLFFREKPRDHWYPGGGIGVAYGKAAGAPGRAGG